MSLTVVQRVGDMLHLAAIVLLPVKLQWSRNAAGVSLKTQELYLLVFVTRYLGLLVGSTSAYNSVMKAVFITYTAMTILMLRWQPSLRASYEKSLVSLHPFMASEPSCLWTHSVAPALALSIAIFVWNFGVHVNSFIMFQTLWWTFSQLLEPFAILPQLVLLLRTQDTGRTMWCYVGLMAGYGASYILVWVCTAADNPWYVHQHVMYSKIISQTIIYVAFLVDFTRKSYVIRHGGELREACLWTQEGQLQMPGWLAAGDALVDQEPARGLLGTATGRGDTTHGETCQRDVESVRAADDQGDHTGLSANKWWHAV